MSVGRLVGWSYVPWCLSVSWSVGWLVGRSVGMSLFSSKSYNFLISLFSTFLFGMQLSYDPVSPGRVFFFLQHLYKPQCLSVFPKKGLSYHFIPSFFVCNFTWIQFSRRSLFISYSTSKSPIVRLSLSKKASRGVKLFHLLICLIKDFHFLC